MQYQLFEYEHPEDYRSVYVVAKNIEQAVDRLKTKYPEAIADKVKPTNGDILTFMYADEDAVFKSGVN